MLQRKLERIKKKLIIHSVMLVNTMQYHFQYISGSPDYSKFLFNFHVYGLGIKIHQMCFLSHDKKVYLI